MTTTTAGPKTRAKRGDLIVIHTQSTDYSRGSRVGPVTTDEWEVALVTSITREGWVRRFRRCEDLDPGSKGHELARWGRVQDWSLVPLNRIDSQAALATAACHVWPGHEMPMTYRSLEEVRAALRPHRIDPADAAQTARQEALSAAAAEWRRERREASQALACAQAEASVAHRQAGYHTREGDGLRSRLDREAREVYFAAQAAANSAYRAAYAAAAS
jgi:hypothetical protein